VQNINQEETLGQTSRTSKPSINTITLEHVQVVTKYDTVQNKDLDDGSKQTLQSFFIGPVERTIMS
jgi:hypothetical protein